VREKRELRRLSGHEAQIARLAVTSDEKTLASCDYTGSLRLWDLRTGREMFELFKHSQAFSRLDFTNDDEELFGYSEQDEKLVEFRWSGPKSNAARE
jgi:WD40 repeat protein